MAWAKGFTRDGWEYRIYFSENDGKFRVEFINWRKEVWLLEELTVQPYNMLYRVYVKGKPTETVGTLKNVVEGIASQIAYRLETEGAIIIRGTKKEIPAREISITPWGGAKLVLGKAVPSAGVVAEILREKREEKIVPAAPPTPTPPAPPKAPPPEAKKFIHAGLGAEGLRRLRVLFESAVRATMGITPTRDMKIMAEDFIYRLDSKYKFVPRDEAIEKATLELLRWIRDEFYYNPEVK